MKHVNWKNPEDYPSVESTSLDRWAFEFLYRNQEFRGKLDSALQAAKVLPDDSQQVGWSESPVGKVLKEYGVTLPMLPSWMEAGISDSPVIFTKHPVWVPSYTVEKAGGLFNAKAIGKRFRVSPSLPDRAALEFDLTQPINPQIERARAILKKSQETYQGSKRVNGKAMVKLYPLYLRVLDADAAGASADEICNVLSLEHLQGVGEDTLRNWRKEARRLRDGGYMEIVKNPNP